MFAVAAAIALATAVSAQQGPPCYTYDKNIEAPCFDLVANKTTYQVRSYAANTLEFWSTASVQGDWQASTQEGFQANFDYIEGDNDQHQKIPMTHPVISQTNDTQNWWVSFFVPSAFSKSLQDVPKSDKISISQMPSGLKIASAVYGGFPSEDEFKSTQASLLADLKADGYTPVMNTRWSPIWASYDSPFTLFNRHNEVWIQVE